MTDIKPGLHTILGNSLVHLEHPKVIVWGGKDWIPVTALAVWNNDEWQMIDLLNAEKRNITAAFSINYAGESPYLPAQEEDD